MGLAIAPGCDWGYAVRAALEAMPTPAPGQPLPSSAKSSTVQQDASRYQAWAEHTLVAAYRRVGRRDARWDAAAEAFLRGSTPALAGQAPAGTATLLGDARRLLRLGCDDPLVLYFAARSIRGSGGPTRETSELLERAYRGMGDVAYPRGVARLVAAGYRADLRERMEGVGKRDALDPVELRWFRESLSDGSYGPDDDVVLLQQLWYEKGDSLLFRNSAAVDAALQATPWIDPWLRNLIAGSRHVKDAWTARGTEYADSVTKEGWKGLDESLERARVALQESWRARPDRPEAAGSMIAVAMAGGAERGETPRLWFDRSVAAQLDYMPAYRALINALRTRWSGDPGALLAFARECYATRRFDTEVPLMAFEAVEQMEWDWLNEAKVDFYELAEGRPVERPPTPYQDPETYALVAAALDGYLRDVSQIKDHARFQGLYAAVTYKAGRYGEAREHLQKAQGKLPDAARRAIRHRMPEGRIEAFGGERGPDVLRAEDLHQAGRLEEARPLFAAARAGATPAARAFLDHRLAVGSLEAELAAGRAVRFLPGPGLAGWTPLIGEWVADPDGSLVGTSGAQGLLINCDARVGADFEVEADIEIVSTTNGQFQAGITFGRPDFQSRKWTSFRIKRTDFEGEVAYFSRHFEKPRHSVSMPIPEKSRVVVQSWNGRLAAFVNGAVVASDYVPEWDLVRGPDVKVGFGAYLDDNTVVVRYRNARLRRLTAAPLRPSPGAKPDAPATPRTESGRGPATRSSR
jgi:hypothetical protein